MPDDNRPEEVCRCLGPPLGGCPLIFGVELESGVPFEALLGL
jgi:hypothetical protein